MIKVAVSKTRRGSNNLEFDVISGSILEKVEIERYVTSGIKSKLGPGNINDYKSFCCDSFEEGSNFIEEVEKEIRKLGDESFKFDVKGYFMVYFQEGKNLLIYSKASEESAVIFRKIPVDKKEPCN